MAPKDQTIHALETGLVLKRSPVPKSENFFAKQVVFPQAALVVGKEKQRALVEKVCTLGILTFLK